MTLISSKVSTFCTDWGKGSETVIHETIRISLFEARQNICVMLGDVPWGVAEAEIYCFPALINPLQLLETGERMGRKKKTFWGDRNHIGSNKITGLPAVCESYRTDERS